MKKFGRTVLFLCCFLIVFSIASVLVIQKPTTDTKGFYQQKKNSIDVLYIGSSHAYCAISPLELYENYGFTGYIRATSCQRSWESYTLLEEALKYQKPKLVVYEVMSAYHGDPQLETYSREVYDTMRPSITKWRGVLTDLEGAQDSDALSRFVPMVRYHERWKSLAQNDFEYIFQKNIIPYKGFALTFGKTPVKDFTSDTGTVNIQNAEPVFCTEKSEDYIWKMKALCDQEGIDFMMLKVPTAYTPYWNAGMSNGMSVLAEKMQVPFVDYNYGNDAIAMDWNEDTCDEGNHLNYYGAQKVTEAFGQWLHENYSLPDHRQEEEYADWEQSCNLYKTELAKVRLNGCSDFLEYMDLVNNHLLTNPDYVVVMTAKAGLLSQMTPEHQKRLLDMGNDLIYNSPDKTEPNIFIRNYDRIIVKKQTPEDITENYDVKGHRFGVNCLGNNGQEVCDLYIDGHIVGKDAMGINIVLYNLKEERAFDTCFAKFDEEGILRIYR